MLRQVIQCKQKKRLFKNNRLSNGCKRPLFYASSQVCKTYKAITG